jgi:autotransporter-associated beta strand protein
MKTPNKNLLKALAAVAVASFFPIAENSMAGVTTNNGITFTFTPTNNTGIGGLQTLSATNSSGILTNGTTVSATGVIGGTGTTGITDTAMSVYGFGTKVTASTKGFVLYEQSTAAATLSSAVASNNLVQFSITAAAGTDIYLTNASGWGFLSGGGTCVSNWGFVYSTNGPINASSSGGVGGANGWTAIGGTGSVAANATNNNIASSGGWGTALTGGANNIKISAGSTYYFALVYWGATSTGASSTALSANPFVLNAYDVVTSSGSLQYWIGGASGNWNTTATSWSTNSSGSPAGTFSQNDSAYITNASTIALTNTGITASGLTVSNSTGTVALTGGSLTSSNLTKAAAGTLTLGMSNTLGAVTISSGTVGIGANNQGAGAVTVNNSSLTGSGTVTGTSFLASNSTISASLAGSGATLSLNGTGVIGVANQTTNSISGNNTFTGNTTINGGRTLVGSGTALGSGTIILAGSAATQQVLDLNGQTLANNITNSGTAFSTASAGNGQIINSATGSATLTGNLASSANFQVTVGSVYDGAAAQIASNGGSITLSGNISTTKVFSKNGVGTLTLSGSNTIATLSAGDGVINAVGTNSLGGGILTGFGSSTNTGTLNLATQAAYTMKSINVGGAVRVNSTSPGTSLEFTNPGATANISVGTANKNFYTDSNTAVTFDGGFEYGGSTATKGSRTINFYNDGAITIQGPVAYTDPLASTNSGFISKQGGNGTLTFNGANTLAGQASIQQGTVVIGAASTLGTYGGVILGTTNSSTLDLSALQSSGYSLAAPQVTITNSNNTVSYVNNTAFSTNNTANFTNTVSAIRGNGSINIGTGTITSSGITPAWYSTITTTNQSGTPGTYTTSQAFYTNAGVTAINGNISFNSDAVTTLNINSLAQSGSVTPGGNDGYDQIKVSGLINYGGILNINSLTNLTSSFSINLFTNFTSYTGDFSSVSFVMNGLTNNLTSASGIWSTSISGTNWSFINATGIFTDITSAPTIATNVWTNGSGNLSAIGITNGSTLVFDGGTSGFVTNNSQVTSLTGVTYNSGVGNNTLSGSNITLGSGGIQNNSSSQQTVALNLSLGSEQTFQAGTGGLVVSGNITNAGNTLTVAGSANTLLSGSISGTGGLTKIGSGSVTLSAANSFSGNTLVSAGTMIVTGSIPNSALTVASGAKLAGNGTLGDVSLQDGGILSPGDGLTTATLHLSSLDLSSNSIMNFTVNGNAADNIVSSGGISFGGNLNLAINGGTYDVNSPLISLFSGNLSGNFTSVTLSGTSVFSGSLSYYDNLALWQVWGNNNGSTFYANVNTATGQMTLIPEPSDYALLGLGLIVIGYTIIRRRKVQA